MHIPWVWGNATVSHLFWILPLPLQSTRCWGPWWFKHWLRTHLFSMLWQIKVPQHPCPNWILLPEVEYKRIFWGKMSISFLVSGAASSLLGQNYCKGGGASFSTFPTMERKVIRQSIFLSQESSFSIESRWGGMKYSLVINEWLLLFPFASVVHTIAESQNCWGWKGLLEIMQSAHLLNQGQIEQVAQG